MRQLFTGLLLALITSSTLAFDLPEIKASELPAQAQHTLGLIDAGGPYPYRRDGVTFQNREQRLPRQARGYYHEYTVDTPGASNRGARRIITGGTPPVVYYYTPDHYRSFSRIDR
jgi:ribonuclease T1